MRTFINGDIVCIMCAKEAEESRCPATMLTGYGKDAGTQSEQASGPVTGTCGGWGGGYLSITRLACFLFQHYLR